MRPRRSRRRWRSGPSRTPSQVPSKTPFSSPLQDPLLKSPPRPPQRPLLKSPPRTPQHSPKTPSIPLKAWCHNQANAFKSLLALHITSRCGRGGFVATCSNNPSTPLRSLRLADRTLHPHGEPYTSAAAAAAAARQALMAGSGMASAMVGRCRLTLSNPSRNRPELSA